MVKAQEFTQLYQLSIHLTDHCNLNCRGCCHFCSVVDKEYFYSVASFSRDIAQLANDIPNVCHVALVGGEPLLHNEVEAFFGLTRESYPQATISLLTNGILLPSVLPKIKEELRRNDIVLSISLYPPMERKIDGIVELLKTNGLRFNVIRMDKFFRMYWPAPIFNKEDTHRRCNACRLLRDGRIYKCVLAANTGYFNRRFGDTFPEDPGIDLHGGASGLEIMRRLEKPVDMCAYCFGRGCELSPWEPMGKGQPEDWYMSLDIKG